MSKVAPLTVPLRPLLLLALCTLPACSSLVAGGTSEVAGIAGAGIASSLTRSATTATAIGLGVAAGANAGLQYEERVVHGAEQDRIAAAAGALRPGTAGPWSVSHDVSVEADEHGQVAVVRDLGAPPIDCKEIVFSVETVAGHTPRSDFYTATVCQDGAHWKWASAEPATARWGSLQ